MLRVCEHCLMGIEAHEGHQPILNIIEMDPEWLEEDEEMQTCDWCGEEDITLYEI